MPRYAAFLRGVSPMNARMPALKAAFEAAGFTEVRTLLSSGNVVFTAPAGSETALERKAEAAMAEVLGRSFLTIIRRVDELQALLAADPFGPFRVPSEAKRIVTFLRVEPGTVRLPIERDGVRILVRRGREVFTAYLTTPKGPVFMTLLEKTFGKEQTTRTWDTVTKAAR